MENEISKLYRLASPYFPSIGELFVAVSAWDERGFAGGPKHCGEFFIFSTKESSCIACQRMYVSAHHVPVIEEKTGPGYVFDLVTTRARHELIDGLVKRTDLSKEVMFASAPLLVESAWYEVDVMFRAGILQRQALSEMSDKSRATLVVQSTTDIIGRRPVEFEEAKLRNQQG
jgi:hypothetical protein